MKSRSAVQKDWWGWLFCAPWILHFLVLVMLPMLASFVFSLYDFAGLWGTGKFVGLGNYNDLLFHDTRFWNAIRNTGVIGLMTVVPGLLMAVGLGALLTGKMPGKGLFRLVIYTPSVIPPVVVALLWGQLLNPRFGLINLALNTLGIAGPPWLGDPTWSKWALAVVSWYGIGGSVLGFAAAFEEVPRELVEAAIIDGAGPLRRFFSVHLPMISPQMFFFLINGVTAALTHIVAPMVLTDGGPAEATMVWPLYMFRLMFTYNKFGHGAASAWIMALVTMLLLWVVFRTEKRWVHYEGGDAE
jgi:multiple sugar transport system permease protein